MCKGSVWGSTVGRGAFLAGHLCITANACSSRQMLVWLQALLQQNVVSLIMVPLPTSRARSFESSSACALECGRPTAVVWAAQPKRRQHPCTPSFDAAVNAACPDSFASASQRASFSFRPF